MSDAPATRITILGAGAWGTALAAALARNGLAVTLWGRDADNIAYIRDRRENRRYLPGLELPDGIDATTDLGDAVGGSDALLYATPSHTFRAMLRAVADLDPEAAQVRPFLWACKGVEPDTHALMHEVVEAECAQAPPHGLVSGPSFAREVVTGLPTALTVATTDAEFAGRAVTWFQRHATPDVVGVRRRAEERARHRLRRRRWPRFRCQCPGRRHHTRARRTHAPRPCDGRTAPSWGSPGWAISC